MGNISPVILELTRLLRWKGTPCKLTRVEKSRCASQIHQEAVRICALAIAEVVLGRIHGTNAGQCQKQGLPENRGIRSPVDVIDEWEAEF